MSIDDIRDQIRQLIANELQKYDIDFEDNTSVPLSVSARHLHLSQNDLDVLFGRGYQLKVFKEISQPGQFAAEEKVNLKTKNGIIKNVRVLGPVRNQTQIEISKSDTRLLGIDSVVRNSGDLKGTPGLTLEGPNGSVTLDEGVIVPDRHIHMTNNDALNYGVSHGEKVGLKISGRKGGILEEVTIRVSDDYSLDTHLDTDDANAFMIEQGQWAKIIKERK